MKVKPTTLSWLGAWGQIGIIVIGVVCWSLGVKRGFLASCVGYFFVTGVGIIGIARTESAIAGPLVYPFIVPGFVPLYYFATQ